MPRSSTATKRSSSERRNGPGQRTGGQGGRPTRAATAGKSTAGKSASKAGAKSTRSAAKGATAKGGAAKGARGAGKSAGKSAGKAAAKALRVGTFNQPSPGISRIDQPERRTHGYFVRVGYKKTDAGWRPSATAFFGDISHGGRKSAWQAAEEWLTKTRRSLARAK